MNRFLCSRSSHLPATARPPAGAAKIDIWLAHYRHFAAPAQQLAMRAILAPGEREKEQRFHFADDRLRYLVTRALTRVTLSRYAAVEPAEWRFSENDFGRPEISTSHSDAWELCFNISHTCGLIALAVTRKRAVGIDVESLVARRASLDIANHFFAPSEVADLVAAAPELRHTRFFEFWTFKEAYIKARGLGLSLPLDRFSVNFPDARSVRLEIDEQLGDDPERWSLWQLRPTPEYLLAVCVERMDDDPAMITVRTVTWAEGGDIFSPAAA